VDTYNILLVDDEVSSLNALRRTLRREYNIFTATNGEDALAIMEQNDIAVIIADHLMPGMTGVEFLERASQKYPETVRILLTGYDKKEVLMDAINTGHVNSYIAKPWEPGELISIVREGIEVYERTRASKIIPEKKKKKIGQILIDYGMISQTQLDTALELQKSEKEDERRKLGEILIDLGYADEESIFLCYSLQLGMPYVSISQLSINREVTELLSSELAYKHTIVPTDEVGRVLVVATSEPLTDRAISEIQEETGHKLMTVCSPLGDIEAALEEYYPKQESIEEELEH
jgi:CheY-like chemotaxis protein